MNYKDLPDYIKMEFDFAHICAIIDNNGIFFDNLKAELLITQLTKEINAIDKQLINVIPATKKSLKPLQISFNRAGEYSKHVKKWMESGNPYKIDNNRLERWALEPPNLNSAAVLRNYLLSNGWKPSDDADAWNYKQFKNKYGKLEKLRDHKGDYIRTTPKLPKKDNQIDDLSKQNPNFRLIADKLKRNHRLHSIEGYIKNVRPDGRIPMAINSCGTNTGRVAHSIVANVPRIRTYYGPELRSLFRASEGKVLVGCDVDGLEARIIAHYFNNKKFTELVLDGDVHQHLYDEFFKDYVKGRDETKNLFYAFAYGAGDIKLGSMCNNKPLGNLKELGRDVKQIFSTAIPGMNKLLKQLEEAFELRGGIRGLDGRFIRCRKKGALLNTLCQSAGAISCKKWTILYRNQLESLRIPSKHIIFYHDSNTEECDKEVACKVGESMVMCLDEAGKHYNLNVPLTAKYSIGNNWAEVK